MSYLNCGRCGLQIKIQAAYLRIENCPRCLARNGVVSPMTLSSRGVTHAVGWGSSADDRFDSRELAEPQSSSATGTGRRMA